ncbi:hypothetical protein ABZ705_20320 [Streptomyces sp. NPDC006984]|uniref:hypothetical protein n=1 Tax=Streptomyces sp. NPDC006984 TaxID=3155463 RepID=UPI0033DA0515
MSISQDDILDVVAEMSVLQVVELIKSVETRSGVSAVAVAEGLTALPGVQDTASEVTDLGAIPGTEGSTERPALIPVTEIKPEDVGTLALHYRDGVPALVSSGGTAFPATLQLVDGKGNVLASYVTSVLLPGGNGPDASVTPDNEIVVAAATDVGLAEPVEGKRAIELNLYLDSLILTGTHSTAVQ